MNRDRIAALVALVAAVLSGTGLPSKLGMSPQLVTVIGGLVVALAGLGRILVDALVVWRANILRRIRGEELLRAPVDWRDIVGAFLGVMAIALGIEGVAVDQLDPDVIAGLSSLGAMLFAWQRGGGGAPPPATTGLVLLVCASGCSTMAAQTLWLGGNVLCFALLSYHVSRRWMPW